ncbi:hypothetical protein J2X65_000473 [Ancylobacter sp. 3268]|uniref:hypothetical protein n=1 Tax=Ancylobacter sp. 3268 TaxID=2817752 RepID=UPI0028634AB9|nr:hypothetical protein [Ancylobacter sp. 3268]MDR6951125.1 hypothetical protein [Ancylobacter sp. 3268]
MQIYDHNPPVAGCSATAEGPAKPAGGTLRIAYTLQRHRQYGTTADRAIFDASGTGFALDTLTFVAGAGPIGQESHASSIHAPHQAAPGPAVFRERPVRRHISRIEQRSR